MELTKTTCKTTGCAEPTHADGLCNACYAKAYRASRAKCKYGCDRKIHARDMCQPCYRRWHHAQANGAEFLPAEPNVPIQPLLDAIEAHGGLEVCYKANGLTSRPKAALDKMLRRAMRRGHLPVSSADKLAIDLLSMHPCFIYGETWWGEINAKGFLEARKQEGLVAA